MTLSPNTARIESRNILPESAWQALPRANYTHRSHDGRLGRRL